MAKRITTLVDDIYALFGSGKEPEPKDIEDLGKAMAAHIANAFKKREHKGLRASNLGSACDRKLWYTVNSPEVAEDVQPWTKIKFLYGHLLEELVLFLAQEAGHEVTHRQDTVEVAGVEGHLDAVIDGVVVDVKSANSRGMDKFYDNGLLEDDPFGYLTQINFYHEGLKNEVDPNQVAFLAIDKELGHLVLDRYAVEDLPGNVAVRTQCKSNLVSSPDVPPRGFFAVPDGKSGNMQLDLQCRYCEFKRTCWPGLRVYKYSNGPRFLTKVVREPEVPEIHAKKEHV